MKENRLMKQVYKENSRLNLNNFWNSEPSNDLKELAKIGKLGFHVKKFAKKLFPQKLDKK